MTTKQDITSLSDADLDTAIDSGLPVPYGTGGDADSFDLLAKLFAEKARRWRLDKVWDVPVIFSVEAATYGEAMALAHEVIEGLDYDEYTKPFSVEVGQTFSEDTYGHRLLRLHPMANPFLVKGSSFS